MIAIERALLGRILTSGDAVEIDASHLELDWHRIIFRAIEKVREANLPVDVLSVKHALEDQLNLCGGPAYLTVCMDEACSKANLPFYSQRIKEAAYARKLVEAAKTVEAIHKDGGDLRTVAKALRKLADRADTDVTHDAEPQIISMTLDGLGSDDPVPWLLPGWMAKGDLILFAAEPKIGKSMVALEIALSIAVGRSAYGMIDLPATARVLYIDEENPTPLARRRIRQHLRGIGFAEAPDAPIRYLIRNGFNLDDDASFARVSREVSTFRPDLIVLDSLVRFHRRSENDNSEMSSFFQDRVRPLQQWGAAILILHHLNKPSKDRDDALMHRSRGASDIPAVADGLWGLTGQRDNNTRTLEHEFCRWEEPQAPLSLRYERSDDGTWARLEASEESEDLEAKVIAHLKGVGAAGALREALISIATAGGYKQSPLATSRVLKRLFDRGTVKKGRQGKVVRYWLGDYYPHATLDGATA